MNRTPPAVALDRVLAGLEKELIDATDEEIELAAQDLGMNVKMKGSAAFIGVIYTVPRRLEDIFDLEQVRRAYLNSARGGTILPPEGREEGS
jgi:hypothetical protein